MTKAVERKGTTPPATLESLLTSDMVTTALAKVLPEQLNATRMIRLCMSALRQTPKLKKCTQESFLGAIMQAAQLGLEPNTPLGHAYLVPYGNECVFIPGYQGLCDLAYRSGRVQSISAHVVFQKDKFEIEYGSEERIIHKPPIGVKRKDRGERIGAYCVVRLMNGGLVQRFLPADEVLSARPSHWQSGVWNDKIPERQDEMWTKTAIKRTLKLAPLSPEMRMAIVADEMASRGATMRCNLETMESTPSEPEKQLASPAPEVFDVPGKVEPATTKKDGPATKEQLNEIDFLIDTYDIPELQIDSAKQDSGVDRFAVLTEEQAEGLLVKWRQLEEGKK